MVRLITGAGGMMGSHLYETLKDLNCDVVPTFFKSTLESFPAYQYNLTWCTNCTFMK